MIRVAVGEPFGGVARPWPPNTTQYNWANGRHDLVVFYSRPQPDEIENHRKGRAEFAFAVWDDVIFFLHRFGRDDWTDSPYSIHLTERLAGPQELPPPFDAPDDTTYRQLLNLTLVDAVDGTMKVLRVSTFAPEFTRALHATIREQAGQPFPGDVAYDQQITAAYRRWRSPQAMLRSAKARCVGGGEQ